MDYNKIEQKDNMKVDSTESSDNKKRSKQEPMVKSKAKPNKGLLGRFIYGFVGPGGIKQIASYVLHDIVYPAAKNVIAESVTSGINMFLFNGDPRAGRQLTKSGSDWGTRRTRYEKQYELQEPETYRRSFKAADYAREYTLSKEDAANVLNSLLAAAEHFGSVAIADYYEKIDVETSFTDNNYGWTAADLSKTTVVRARDGWLIKFPPVRLLSRE